MPKAAPDFLTVTKEAALNSMLKAGSLLSIEVVPRMLLSLRLLNVEDKGFFCYLKRRLS